MYKFFRLILFESLIFKEMRNRYLFIALIITGLLGITSCGEIVSNREGKLALKSASNSGCAGSAQTKSTPEERDILILKESEGNLVITHKNARFNCSIKDNDPQTTISLDGDVLSIKSYSERQAFCSCDVESLEYVVEGLPYGKYVLSYQCDGGWFLDVLVDFKRGMSQKTALKIFY